MALIDPVLGLRLIFILGIINIVGFVLVLLSCRCIMGAKLAKGLWQSELYKKFYSKHCYYWWLFLASVLLHTTLAFLVFGLPQ